MDNRYKRGRPRLYADNAQRERAYRERLSEDERDEQRRRDRVAHQEARQADVGTMHQREADRQRRKRTISNTSFKSALLGDSYKHPDVLNIGGLNVVCNACGAMYFEGEMKDKGNTFDKCCNFGAVQITIPSTTPKLKELMLADSTEGQHFRNNIRTYNNAFAMAALSAKLDTFRGPGPFCFRLQGQVYHKLPSVTTTDNPKHAQLYFIECDEANKLRLENPGNRNLKKSIVKL